VPKPVTAGRNERAYLIQSYARHGNGKMVMMREIDVPVRLEGRHWAAFVDVDGAR
jgi:methyl-accepting chemotaxis protein